MLDPPDNAGPAAPMHDSLREQHPTTTASSKKYLCYDFEGCKAGYPVKVCTFDGAHTPSLVEDQTSTGDDGLKAFIPTLAWKFISQF